MQESPEKVNLEKNPKDIAQLPVKANNIKNLQVFSQWNKGKNDKGNEITLDQRREF